MLIMSSEPASSSTEKVPEEPHPHSIKHKFQGPQFVIPRALSDYVLNVNNQTPESYEKALNAKYGRDDYITLCLHVTSLCTEYGPLDDGPEYVLLCDSRARVDKLIEDLVKLLEIDTDYVQLELHGGKRLHLQKPDAVLRDIAYKQSNEGSDKFFLEMKLVPSESMKAKIMKQEEEEEKARKHGQYQQYQEYHQQHQAMNDGQSSSSVPSTSSPSCSSEANRKEMETVREPAGPSELMRAINAPVAPAPVVIKIETPVALPEEDETLMDDDEMPSLTVEAPSEEASFEAEQPSPQVPQASIEGPSQQQQIPGTSQQKRQVARGSRTNMISYHDLPPGTGNAPPMACPQVTLKLEKNVPFEAKIRAVAGYTRKPISEVQKMRPSDLESIFHSICIASVQRIKRRNELVQQLQEINAQSCKSPTMTMNKKFTLAKAYQRVQNEIEKIDREQILPQQYMNMPPMPPQGQQRLPPPAYPPGILPPQQNRQQGVPPQFQRSPQFMIGPDGQRYAHPYMQLPNSNQRARILNTSSVQPSEEVRNRLVKIEAMAMNMAQLNPPRPPPPQPPHRALQGELQFLRPGAPDPCNFRPDSKQTYNNTYVTVASPATLTNSIIPWHFPPYEKSGRLNVSNTIKAINEYRLLCNSRQADPASFLEFYFLGDPMPHFNKILSIADYNMYLSRRRCDEADVKIHRMSHSDQLQLYLLELQSDESNVEKWKTFYRIMQWDLPLNNEFPRILLPSSLDIGRPVVDRKKKSIDQVMNHIHRMHSQRPPSMGNSSTSSEASSTSPTNAATATSSPASNRPTTSTAQPPTLNPT
ncbi:Sop-2-related protein 1 [Caenorhabditis elegans]|uniref:Sop-2-related protein 1 n=1 Tax=Caenorhabditis elegans TaxID=6239 RepID=UPI0013A7DCBB|nr:Sop-2-related protein 1 [Caenorhabditis elegans]CCD66163.2 Sop-2-related protein 1 [Caenorhabditis elegans]